MPEYRLYANGGCVTKESDPSQNFPLPSAYLKENNAYMLMGFEQAPDYIKFKGISSVTFMPYVYSGFKEPPGKNGELYWISSRPEFTAATFNNVQLSYVGDLPYIITQYTTPQGYCPTPMGNSSGTWYTLGIAVKIIRDEGRTPEIYSPTYPDESYRPYAKIIHTGVDLGIQAQNASPSSGYVNPAIENRFSWDYVAQGNTLEPLTVSSANFIWKQGESGTEHTTSIGTNGYIDINADTFPLGAIKWKVVVTANSGVVNDTGWYSISTVEVSSSAETQSPVGQIIDGTAESVFRWQHIISTGTQPTGADLQKSQDGTNWTNLKSVFGAATETTIPANTFTAGTWYWRVRTYNTDEVEGSWSEAAQIIVIAAPDAPGIYVERSAPNWMIRWQQSGQQAYEIRLDGEKIAAGFGQQSNYAYDSWTEPGSHTVEVRIQSAYGLWSPWGTASLQITNTPGPGITLVAEASESAPESLLTWNGGDYDRFIVYRDGKKIGETEETSFTDHFGAGAVSYQVRGVYDDTGFYGLSNSATLTIQVPELSLYDVTEKSWLSIELSEVQSRVLNGSVSRAAAFLHFAGTEKPSVEFGEAIDRVISFDCAFRKDDAVSAAAFEAMMGHTVCLKLQTGETIIGALTAYNRKYTSFYTAFSSAVTETEFSEVDANG